MAATMPTPALALKALRRCLQSPAFARDLGKYVANDVKSALEVYKYPTRRIFVIGLPKSGDAWLHSMLLSLPGFNPRYHRSLSVKDGEGRFIPRYDTIISTSPSLNTSRSGATPSSSFTSGLPSGTLRS